jgi:hypothetical protein
MKRLWKVLLVIIIIAFILIALSPAVAGAVASWLTTAGFPTLAAVVTGIGGLALPWYVAVGAALGLAYLVDPDTTTEIISDLGEVVGEVGGAVGDAVGDVAGGLLKNAWPWILGGVALWFAFTGNDEDTTVPVLLKEKDDSGADPGAVEGGAYAS